MDYSKLSDAQLQALYNNDYSKLSDDELRDLYGQVKQTPQVQEPTVQQEPTSKGKGLDITPSGLVKQALPYAVTLGRLLKEKGGSSNIENLEDLQSYHSKSADMLRDFKQSHPILTGGGELATDIAGYTAMGGATGLSKLPVLESAVIGGIEGLKNEDILGGMATGGLIGGAVRYGKPAIDQVNKVVANKILNSNVINNIARFTANVPQYITRYAKKHPEVIQQGKGINLLDDKLYYANKFKKLGQLFKKDIEDTKEYIQNKLSEETEKFKNIKLDIEQPDFNKLLMEDLPNIFKSDSDLAYKSISNNPTIASTLKDYYKKVLYDKKPTTLWELNKLKEDLVDTIKSKYSKVNDKIGQTSRMSNEQKLTNKVERTIDNFLKSRNPELAKWKNISNKKIKLEDKLKLGEGNIADKLENYGSPASEKSLESKYLKELQDMLKGNRNYLREAMDLKTQETLNRLTPEAQGNVQRFMRQVFPYIASGAFGAFVGGLNPQSIATGLTLAGLATTPKTYGKIIQNLSKKANKNVKFGKTTEARELVRRLLTSRLSDKASPTPLLEGYISKTRED